MELLKGATDEGLLSALLERHRSGDRGDVPPGLRIVSSYRIADETLWVMTEAGRSATTILLSEDY